MPHARGASVCPIPKHRIKLATLQSIMLLLPNSYLKICMFFMCWVHAAFSELIPYDVITFLVK